MLTINRQVQSNFHTTSRYEIKLQLRAYLNPYQHTEIDAN